MASDFIFKSEVQLDSASAEKKLKELVAQYDKLQSSLGKPLSIGGGSGGLGALDNQVKGLSSSFVGMDGTLRSSSSNLGAIGNAADGLGGKLGGLGTTGAKGLGGLGGAIGKLGPAMLGPAAGAAALGAGLLKVIEIGGDFETQVADMAAIIGSSPEQTDRLAKSARELSVAWGVSATQGVESFKLIISALGPEVAKDEAALKSMANTTLQFAKASGLDAATATNALTVTLSQFGFSALDTAGKAKKMEEISHLLAAAAQEGAAEVPELAAAMEKVGATGKDAGASMAQTAAALELLAPAGIKGGEAGTALKGIFSKLATGSDETTASLKSIGLTFHDINPSKVGLTKSLETLRDAYAKIKDPVEQDTLMTNLFGLESANAAKVLLASAGELDKFTTKITGTSAAQEQAAVKMNTFQEGMNKLKVKLEDVAITLFNALKPALDIVVDVLGFVIDLIDPLLQALGFLWGLLAEGIKWIIGLAKSFGEWVMSLEWVQAIVKKVQDGWKGMIMILGMIKVAVAASFGKVVEWVKQAYSWLATKLQPVMKAISNFIASAWKKALDYWVWIFQKITGVIKTVWGWIKKLWDMIIGAVSAVVKFIAKCVGLGGVLNDVTGFIKKLVKAIGGFVEDVARFLGILGDSNEKAGEKAGQTSGQNWLTGFQTGIGDTANQLAANAGNAAGQEFGGGMAEGTAESTEKEKTKVTNELLDFWDEVVSASRAARDARQDIFAASIADELTRIDFDHSRKITAIREGYADELNALEKKLEDAKKKQAEAIANKEIYNLEIKNLEEARAALLSKQNALIAKENDDRLRAHQALLLKLYTEELAALEKSHADILAANKLRIESERALLDTTTIEGFRADTKLQLDLLALDYKETARDIAEADPLYQQAVDGIAGRVKDGLISATDAAMEQYQLLKDTIARLEADGNSLLAAVLRAHLKKREDLLKASLEKESDMEEAALLKGSFLLRLALSLRENIFRKHFDELRKMREEDNADAQKKFADGVAQLRKDMLSGAIDRQGFGEKLIELNKDLEANAGEQKTIWTAAAAATRESMDGMLAGVNERLTEQMKTTHSEAQKVGSDWSGVWTGLGNIGKTAMEDLTTQLIQFSANTHKSLKDFALGALAITLGALRKYVSIAIAEIIIKSLAANPILGAVVAAGAVAAVNIALGAAEAAASGGFFSGGYTGDGNPRDAAGIVHKREIVMNHLISDLHKPFLLDVSSGMHPLTAALARYGHTQKAVSDRSGVVYDHRFLTELQATRAETRKTRRAVEDMAKDIDIRRSVNVSGRLTASAGQIAAELQSADDLRRNGFG